MNRLTYLDHAATSPLHPDVLAEMMPYLTSSYGNPSATYGLARDARNAIVEARKSVAEVLDCRPNEVVFTSGGTESINAAIKGVAFQQKKARSGHHIVTSQIEHHAVLLACQYLERFGFDVTYLPVDRRGFVDPADVGRAMTPDTALVSIMAANNEVGTIQPIEEIAAVVRARALALKRRIPLHTDAVQAATAIPLRDLAAVADVLSLSAHKFGGPKGMGVLYIGKGVPFLAQQNGGGQERQRRAGTEDVAGIVGTAVALQMTQKLLVHDVPRVRALSRRLADGVLAAIRGSHLNGDPSIGLANNVNISFEGADARDLLAGLDAANIACSAGAVCGATTLEPSHVLLAMGLPLDRAVSTLRFSPGPETTDADIDRVLDVLPRVVAAARVKVDGADAAG